MKILTEQIFTRVSKKDLRELKRTTKKMEMSQSAFIREAVKRFVWMCTEAK